ncbi:MAG TPA: cytochrome c oxidase assembly factor Coa1 family protein [Geobacteraceae bacterium]
MINKKLITIITVVTILLTCFFSGLYVIAIRSEPYSFAVKFIKENKIVIEKLGELKSSHLAFFSYSVRYNGPDGHAEYKIYVTGETRKGTVYLNLIKSAGLWDVVKGNLELENGAYFTLI